MEHDRRDEEKQPVASDGGFEQLLQESLDHPGTVVLGEKVQARVFNIGKDYLFLDLGAREEGLLPRAELETDGELSVEVGDTITVLPLQIRDGAVICGHRLGAAMTSSENAGDRDLAWATLQEAFDQGMPVEGTVKELNKGGFTVTVMSQRAFCPISQIENGFCSEAEQHLGRTYSFLVQELDTSGRNLVVSRRRLLQEEAEEKAAELWQRLEEGGVYDGRVSSVKGYGAFVDIGGIEGLLHVSEIDYDRVDDPASALEPGQPVRVTIKSIDWAKRRISLSRKALLEDPWLEVSRELAEGQVASGRVVRLAQFGAFVELRRGVEGLVHISEMGQGKRLNSPREAVQVGDAVQVRVLQVDLERRRMSLSLDDVDGSSDRPSNPPPHRPAKSSPGLGTLGDLLGNALKKK